MKRIRAGWASGSPLRWPRTWSLRSSSSTRCSRSATRSSASCCSAAWEDLGATGRTIVFVSHNMQAITSLCDRTILLEKGRVVLDGPDWRRRHGISRGAFRRGLAPGWPNLATRPATTSFASARSGRCSRTAPSQRASTFAARSGSKSTSRCFARPSTPSSRRSSSSTAKAGRVQRDRHASALARTTSPRDYSSRPGYPPTCSTRGSSSSRRRWSSSPPRGSASTPAVRDALSFHVHDPGDGDSSRGLYLASWRGSVRPLLDLTVEER